MLADSKKSRTFASLLKRSTSERKSWRDGRVVDRGGLENRCTERYRGFESLSLRQVEVVNHKICNLFFYELFFHSFVSFIKTGTDERLRKDCKMEMDIHHLGYHSRDGIVHACMKKIPKIQ